MSEIIETVQRYINTNNQPFQRYNSWNHCFRAFNLVQDTKMLSLQLGFYLASWGMYRGSSGLLQKDYLIHENAVNILIKHRNLRCDKNNEMELSKLPKTLDLIEELSTHYKSNSITPTDTLISKIILGTLGCLPAFDRFFLDGVKKEEQKFKTLKEKSLLKLLEFVEKNKVKLLSIQYQNSQYPIMKIIDMYFWQIGYDLHSRNSN